jgi:ABC-type multidrug transport system, ATPase and permease components
MKAIQGFMGKRQLLKGAFIAFIFLGITIIELTISYIIKETIDIDQSYSFLKFIPLLCIFSFLYGIGKFIGNKQSTDFAAKIVRHKKKSLTKHIQNLPTAILKKYDIGNFYTEIQEKMPVVEEFLRVFPSVIAAPIVLILTLCIMFLFSWKLTLVCIITIPIPAFLFGIINKPIQKKTTENLKNEGKVNEYLKSTIEGLDIIKTYSLYNLFSKRFHHLLTRVEEKGLEVEKTKAKTTPLSYILRIFPQCIIPLYCGYLALNGEGTIGLLPAFSLLIGNVFTPIESILKFLTKYREVLAIIQRYEKIEAETEERMGGALPLLNNKKIIAFSNVSFAYQQKNVLEKITFVIEEKKLVAIVGKSGSGKSTITKLICGLYENYSGSIQVFQREVRESNLVELRKQIAVMPQTAYLLSDTIRANMVYGVKNYTEEDIEKAIKMTNLNEVTAKFKEGTRRVLSDRGTNLSKGQRQRIVMARVILRKASLIILDEATAGLDSSSIDVISETLGILKKQHTILMVTHDIGLAAMADEVILMHDHNIIKIGTHEELMKEPIYYEMYTEQQS